MQSTCVTCHPREMWRPITLPQSYYPSGYDGLPYEKLYLISNRGRIKTIPRTVLVTQSYRSYYITYKERNLNPTPYYGYYKAVLSLTYSGLKMFPVHRLVAFAFKKNPKPDEWQLVRHLDDVRSHNCAKNLAWGDYVMNKSDWAANKGTKRKRLPDSVVRNVRKVHSKTPVIAEVARKTNLPYLLVYGILNHTIYNRVP